MARAIADSREGLDIVGILERARKVLGTLAGDKKLDLCFAIRKTFRLAKEKRGPEEMRIAAEFDISPEQYAAVADFERELGK